MSEIQKVVLCLSLPGSQTQYYLYESAERAQTAVTQALLSGRFVNASPEAHTTILTMPGTVFRIISHEAFLRAQKPSEVAPAQG